MRPRVARKRERILRRARARAPSIYARRAGRPRSKWAHLWIRAKSRWATMSIAVVKWWTVDARSGKSSWSGARAWWATRRPVSQRQLKRAVKHTGRLRQSLRSNNLQTGSDLGKRFEPAVADSAPGATSVRWLPIRFIAFPRSGE